MGRKFAIIDLMGQQKKNIRLIFLYLAFHGLSIGVWSDFAQVWLNEQGITVSNIGLIIACATFVAGIIIIVLTKYVRKVNELFVLKVIFLLKAVFLLLMFLGAYFSVKWLCVFSFILDSVIDFGQSPVQIPSKSKPTVFVGLQSLVIFDDIQLKFG